MGVTGCGKGLGPERREHLGLGPCVCEQEGLLSQELTLLEKGLDRLLGGAVRLLLVQLLDPRVDSERRRVEFGAGRLVEDVDEGAERSRETASLSAALAHQLPVLAQRLALPLPIQHHALCARDFSSLKGGFDPVSLHSCFIVLRISHSYRVTSFK